MVICSSSARPTKEVEGIAVATDPMKDIATDMRAEIERIFNLSKKYTPA